MKHSACKDLYIESISVLILYYRSYCGIFMAVFLIGRELDERRRW